MRLVPGLGHAGLYGAFACSEECTDFTLAWMRDELLDKGASGEESGVATVLLVSSSLLFDFDVNGSSARLEEA